MRNIGGIMKKLGKRTVGLTLAPSVLILLIGLLFGWGIQSAVIAVYNGDAGFDMPGLGKTSIPEQMINGLDKNVFKVIKSASESDAFKAVQDGKASIAISFPADFTQEMMIKIDDPSYAMEKKIRIKVDKANPIVMLMTVGKLAGTLAKNAKGLPLDKLSLPVDVSTLQEGGFPNIGAFMMTGIFILLIFIITVIATVAVTLDAFKGAAEMNSGGFRGSLIAVFTVIYAIQAALLFVTGAFIFRVNIPGHLWLATLPVLLMVFTGSAFGVFFAGVAKDVSKMPGAAIFAVLPVFFGGVILPLELLPFWLRWFCFLMPPFYTAQAFRSFTFYGNGFTGGLLPLGLLLLFGIFFTVLAIVSAGREHNKKAS